MLSIHLQETAPRISSQSKSDVVKVRKILFIYLWYYFIYLWYYHIKIIKKHKNIFLNK